MVTLTPKERIEKVVCWAGLSTNAFALQIGLSSPQSLYQIKVGKHNISRTIAERICARYPEINFGWIFAGEGEMLRPSEAPIPYYTADCTEVALGKAGCIAAGSVVMPECGDCDFVAPYKSHTMEPEIRQGSLLFCKECSLCDVVAGATVLVSNGRVAWVRKVAEVGASELTLHAGTHEHSPLRLDISLIRRVFIVKAVLEWKTE